MLVYFLSLHTSNTTVSKVFQYTKALCPVSSPEPIILQ